MCAFKKDGFDGGMVFEKFIPKEKRDYCLKELVETEAKYVEVLQMLKNYFIKSPILVLKEQDRATIFMNIPQLIDLHQNFYAKILDHVSKYIQQSRKSSLGNIFIEFKHQFLLYSTFCCDLPKGKLSSIPMCNFEVKSKSPESTLFWYFLKIKRKIS